MSVFNLNDKQKKEFNKLVAAYKKCEKLGVLFVNNYGTMEAYNKEYVETYTDKTMNTSDGFAVSTDNNCALNTFKTDSGWTDDEHLIILTPLGEKLYKEE